MRKTRAVLLAAFLLLGAVLAGCGSSVMSGRAMSAMEGDAAYDDYYDYYDDWGGEYAAMAEPAYAANSESYGQSVSGVRALSTEYPDAGSSEAKIIYTASLRMESLEFDGAVEGLAALTAACGGYYEYSSVNDSGSVRSADFTVRVPAEKYRQFMDGAGELCHVLNVQEHTEDVSESYYDTEGRVRTQRIKLERLQDLLEQAEYMEDIIVLENAISETEELIDRLSGQLRHYDALVDYSTVEIYLAEVKEMTVIEEEEPTFGERMSAAFSEGWESFSGSMEDIAVFFAYSWQWLVIVAVIVVVVLLIVRRAVRAERAREAARAARKQAAAAARQDGASDNKADKNTGEKL